MMGNCNSVNDLVKSRFTMVRKILVKRKMANSEEEEKLDVEEKNDKRIIPMLISKEEKQLNLLFVADDAHVKEKLVVFGGKADWESLLTRVAMRMKPLATVALRGKLAHTWHRVILPQATKQHVRIIGPYPDPETNLPMITLVHEDSLGRGITLRSLCSEEECDYFGHDQDPIFDTQLVQYTSPGPDLRRGNNYLECALVYGYPLDRAMETL